MIEPDESHEIPIACQLTDAERDRRRGGSVQETLTEAIRGVEERPDGYEFVFAGSDGVMDAVATFLQRETACCPFARFEVEVTPGLDEVRLLFAGPEGTKDLLEEGLFRDEEFGPAIE